MSTEIKLFEGNQIRFITTVENDSFYVVGKDVLRALEYPESSIRQQNNIFRNIPDEWKGHKPIMTPGGTQQMLCLSEQGLYFFLGRSDKPKAIPYQRWIAGEVVPSIRRTGSYSLQQTNQVLQAIEQLTENVKALQLEMAEVKPKVEFYNNFILPENCCDMKTTAKTIGKCGRNTLFRILREKGYLMSDNQPYQRYISSGMFKLRVGKFLKPVTMVTAVGLEKIKKILDS